MNSEFKLVALAIHATSVTDQNLRDHDVRRSAAAWAELSFSTRRQINLHAGTLAQLVGSAPGDEIAVV